MSYEFLEHTGDTAVRLRGRDATELFKEAVRAVAAIYMDAELSAPVERRESFPLDLQAEDGVTLLVDFLNEIIYLFDAKRFLVAELEVERLELGPPASLRGALKGETMDPARHAFKTEIKAATFHGLEIRAAAGQLAADVVFDL